MVIPLLANQDLTPMLDTSTSSISMVCVCYLYSLWKLKEQVLMIHIFNKKPVYKLPSTKHPRI